MNESRLLKILKRKSLSNEVVETILLRLYLADGCKWDSVEKSKKKVEHLFENCQAGKLLK